MNKNILIHVDTRQRDAFSYLWISNWLKQKGFRPLLCNRQTSSFYMKSYNPIAYVGMRPNDFSEEELETLTKKTKIFVLPTENAAINKTSKCMVLAGNHNYRGFRKYSKYVTKIFVWGPKIKEWLLEEDIYDEDQIVVCGCPRYDAYLVQDQNEKKEVGILCSFAHINVFDDRNRFEHFDQMRRAKEGVLFSKGRNIEDLYWYSYAGLRLIFELLDKLSEKNIYSKIRPHTNEFAERYNYLVEKYQPCLRMDFQTDITSWIRSSFVVLAYRTSAIVESILSDVPAINLMKILGSRLDDHMNLPNYNMDMHKFIWQPESMEECISMIEKAKTGALPTLRTKEGIDEMLYSMYAWPRKEPATLTIANEIEKSLIKEKIVFAVNNSNEKIYYKLLLFGKLARTFLLLLLGLMLNQKFIKKIIDISKYSISVNNRYNFYPFHLRDKKVSKDAWGKIKEYVSKNNLKL